MSSAAIFFMTLSCRPILGGGGSLTPGSASNHNDSDVMRVQKSKYVRRAEVDGGRVHICFPIHSKHDHICNFCCRLHCQLNVKSLLVN